MKILILNYEYPPIGGGAGVVSQYHAQNMAKMGHFVTVVTTWYKGEKEIEESQNLKIIRLKSKRRYTYKSNFTEWISWIIKSKQFLKNYLVDNPQDFCFAHFSLPGGEVAQYLKKKFNLEYAVVSHGQDIPWFFPKQMFKYHIVTYFWIKYICKNASKLVLLTENMKQNADKFMGKRLMNKNIIVPNGCQVAKFYPDYTKRNSDKLKIIFIGRLVEQKAPFVFLKALVLLKKEIGSNFEVNILGDGKLRNKMYEFVLSNNLKDEVNFKGWLNKEDVLQAYQYSDIQVVSSEAEAMSIAVLESLSTGLYVLSTPVSGNTELIKNGINGELFDFGNHRELSQKMTAYYNDKFKNNYHVPDDFLEQFRATYSWENVVSELLEKCFAQS